MRSLSTPFRAAVALIALCLSAQVTLAVPWGATTIPFSLQSLAVFLIGWYLPVRWSAVVVLAYLLLGTLGLPVFADGESGWSVLRGGSGGFLQGFFWSVVFLGIWKYYRPATRHRAPLGFLLATIVLFAFGLLHLTVLYDFSRAVAYGLAPFWVVALLKVGVLWLITVGYAHLVGRFA